MDRKSPPPAKASPPSQPPAGTPVKNTFWKKFGGTSFFLSVVFHLILIIIGLFWVFQIIHEPDKKVDFMPPSGGGGSPAADAKTKKHQVRMVQPSLSRLSAMGAASNLVLPEPDDLSAMTSIGSMSSSSLSSGLGGGGSGGGKGNGTGDGVGDGFGSGMGNGGGLKNPFGMTSPDKSALVGTFYDLKQTKDGKPTGFQEAETLKEISNFVTRGGWNTRAFDKFYKAPNTLYQTKLYIPIMSAAEAPNAFGCGKDVQPVHWVALYRGYVIPPASGKFRFVGRADNVMVIRFNSQVVLDGGDYSARLAKSIWDPANINLLAGRSEDRAAVREAERAGYGIPVKSYNYSNAGQYNERGGLMVGKDFTVTAGKRYPVEILLSELGGLFGSVLLIEQDGVAYEKDTTGSPILPIFRVDASVPTVPTETRGSPPYDPNGPVWKVVDGQMTDGI